MIGSSLETRAPRAVKLSTSDRNIVLAAKGGGVVFAGQIMAQVLRLISGVVVARFLGAQQFGLFRLGLTFAELQSGFALLGLETGVVRHISIFKKQNDEKRLWGTIQIALIVPGAISLTLGLFLFSFAELVANQVFHEPALTPVLRLLSWHIPLVTLLTMAASIAQGFKKVQYNVYASNIGARSIKLVLATGFLVAGFGLRSVVIAQLIASTTALIMFLYLLHTTFPLNRPLRAAKLEAGKLLRFSFPIYVSKLLEGLSGSLETLVLGFFGMTAGVGVFAVAGNLSALSTLFHRALGDITAPLFAELHSQKEYDQLKVIYQSTTKWGVSFSLAFFLTVLFFGEALLSIFGKEFKAGAIPLIILAVGSFFNALTGRSGSMINMIGRSKITALNSVIYLAATLVIDFALIPRWGVEGAALAVALTGILINLLRVVEVYIFLRFWPFNWSFFKLLAASMMAAAAGYAVSQLLAQTPLIVQVALGIFAVWGSYALMIVLLKLSPEDRLILNRLKKRLSNNISSLALPLNAL